MRPITGDFLPAAKNTTCDRISRVRRDRNAAERPVAVDEFMGGIADGAVSMPADHAEPASCRR